MRLIDADKLLEVINNQDNWLGQMELAHMANINIYSLINTMPTVEMTDRPQGKWSDVIAMNINLMYGVCDQCHMPAQVSAYCGNCGAKMISTLNVSDIIKTKEIDK